MKKNSQFVKANRAILIAIFSLLFFSGFFIRGAGAAQLYFFPSEYEIIQGDTAVFEVRMNGNGDAVNAFKISGAAENGNSAEIIGAKKEKSVSDLWIRDPSAKDNAFYFEGGMSSPIKGEGIIGTVLVRAKSAGEIVLKFNADSILLRADGKGTSISPDFFQAAIHIIAPGPDYIRLSSRSHPSQDQWSSIRDFLVSWDAKPGKEFSYLLSFDPTAVPDDIADTPVGDINLSNLKDGIYYFSLKEIGGKSVSRWHIKIDSVSPEPFDILYSKSVDAFGAKPAIFFNATDSLSGIERYQVKLKKGDPLDAVSPFILEKDYWGSVSVRAFDGAGNIRESSIYIQPSVTKFDILILLGILIGIVLLAWIVRRIIKILKY